MSKLAFSVGAAVLGSLVVAACVGDASAPPTNAQGTLNGPCFANDTCNDGLFCDVVHGSAKCVPFGDASPNDSSPTTDAADAGLPKCNVSPTAWPMQCPGGAIGASCFGQTQTCTATGCSNQGDMRWECFSPNQCSNAPCCLSPTDGTLTPQKNCTQGTLTLAGTPNGAICGSGSACKTGDTQLCQFNSQCPEGQICSAVRVVASTSPAIHMDVLGACMTP